MAAKKRKKSSGKKKAAPKKRKAAKRKAAPKAAAPKAAPKKKRKKAKRKAPAAAAPAAAPKKPRKKASKRKASGGHSGPGQFAVGRPNDKIEVRRADDGHFSKLRSTPAKSRGPGQVEALAIHRNPVDTGMFILTAAAGGGAGFGLATFAGRLYVTSDFALSREVDAAGNKLYAVDASGKITHADGTPVTGTDYAATVDSFSWMRELISFGIAGVSILGGMYAFEPGGVPRTAALWLGVGSAVEGGSNLFGKLVLPWMLRKNKTFATRLAPAETNVYLLQHPDALKDQPSGDAWTVAGAPLGGAPRNTALGSGCSGDGTCGCGSCCSKRSQALQNCIQHYANQAPPAPARPAPTPAMPNPALVTHHQPSPAPPTTAFATGGGGDDNVRPFVSTRDQARARNSA